MVRVRTGSGREVFGLVDALDGRTGILDGELVACPEGRPDFYALNPNQHPITVGFANKLIRPENLWVIDAVGGQERSGVFVGYSSPRSPVFLQRQLDGDGTGANAGPQTDESSVGLAPLPRSCLNSTSVGITHS